MKTSESACDVKSRLKDVLADEHNALIPRIVGAGTTVDNRIVMHNGIQVYDSYYPDIVTEILKGNRGCHEPEEEYHFQEVLKEVGSDARMIEIGAYWGFYSLWFHFGHPDRKVVLVEPAEESLMCGQANFELNGMSATFIEMGLPEFLILPFCQEQEWGDLDILHADVQEAEIFLLQQLPDILSCRMVKHLFFSAHSDDTNRVLEGLAIKYGYRIRANTRYSESNCFDGVFVASEE